MDKGLLNLKEVSTLDHIHWVDQQGLIWFPVTLSVLCDFCCANLAEKVSEETGEHWCESCLEKYWDVMYV